MEMARSIMMVRMSFRSCRPQPPKQPLSRPLCDAEFVKVGIVCEFRAVICLLIVTDADDAGKVIAPYQSNEISRIGVSNSVSITCVFDL